MAIHRVHSSEIYDALRRLEARGERPSIQRVQKEMGYDYDGVSDFMRAHQFNEATMNRTLSGRGLGLKLRADEAVRPREPRDQPPVTRVESLADGTEPSIEPYKTFLSAMLQQAIKDAKSGSGDNRSAAWRWLQADPQCADICDWLEMDHDRLILALEAGAA